MPTYILLSTLTPEGRHSLHKNPERIGAWDFVTIVEAPDNETAAHLAIDLGSRGTVNIQTLPALSLIDLRKVMKGPKQMGKK